MSPASVMPYVHRETSFGISVRPGLLRGVKSDLLFVSYRGKPLYRYNVNKMVLKTARAAGVTKHITCHSWRHTCATHLVKNHANLRHVQHMLGHASLATTERYLHLTITDLKEAHTNHHPRGKEDAH